MWIYQWYITGGIPDHRAIGGSCLDNDILGVHVWSPRSNKTLNKTSRIGILTLHMLSIVRMMMQADDDGRSESQYESVWTDYFHQLIRRKWFTNYMSTSIAHVWLDCHEWKVQRQIIPDAGRSSIKLKETKRGTVPFPSLRHIVRKVLAPPCQVHPDHQGTCCTSVMSIFILIYTLYYVFVSSKLKVSISNSS